MKRANWLAFFVKLIVLLACGFYFASPAKAAYVPCTSPSLPINMVYSPTLKIASSVPVGAVIPGSVKPFTITGSCTIGSSFSAAYPNTVQVGSTIVACTANGGSTEISPGVYSTGISGIGMQLLNSAGQPISGGTSQACNDQISTIQGGGAFNFSGTFQLIRIAGTIPTNAVFTPSLAQWIFGVYSTGLVLNNNTSSSSLQPSGSIILNSLTCNVTYPSNIALPSVKASALVAAGASAGSTYFSIGLNCNDSAVVGITMDAAAGYTVQAPANGVLGIQGGVGQASGVGVQILDADQNPMPLRQRVGKGSIAANQQNQYDFYARYYSMSGSVTPGAVSSALVFTFDYQ